MSPANIGVGIFVAALVVAGFAALEFNAAPDDQHLIVQNDFADADCRMDFANGANDSFSVRKNAEHSKTYKAPREGFINMRCTTDGKTVEIPGSFHMRHGELTRLTLKKDGTAEYAFERKL